MIRRVFNTEKKILDDVHFPKIVIWNVPKIAHQIAK